MLAITLVLLSLSKYLRWWQYYEFSFIHRDLIQYYQWVYRDAILSLFRSKSSTQLEKIKNKLQRLFKKYDLEITSDSNQKFVNFLRLTLNLKDSTIRPYHKPDEQMLPQT